MMLGETTRTIWPSPSGHWKPDHECNHQDYRVSHVFWAESDNYTLLQPSEMQSEAKGTSFENPNIELIDFGKKLSVV